jgi:K+-sensing histidine kinase KdpD
VSRESSRGGLVDYLASSVVVGVCLVALRFLPMITAGAAAPILLLVVLVISMTRGTGPGLFVSALTALGYSYYFLPPAGFGIENPNDWVEFVTFTSTALIVGELASRAEHRRLEALEGRLEIERLYKELESAFERASEAEAARRNEQLKAALLDALTHNLRTPLTSIKAAVTALLGDSPSSGGSSLTPDERHELLQVIDEESDRLNRFIEGLSAADRATAAHAGTGWSVAPREVVQTALARAGTLTRDHRVVVSVDDLASPIAADGAVVAEALYILLDNASKYSRIGTEIRVVVSQRDGRMVRLEVSDDGPGIPEDMRERVFEKFFRLPGREAGDPRRKGVWLGLSIARRLVEAQGGRIWVEPSASGGTALVMTLPASTSAATDDGRSLESVAS